MDVFAHCCLTLDGSRLIFAITGHTVIQILGFMGSGYRYLGLQLAPNLKGQNFPRCSLGTPTGTWHARLSSSPLLYILVTTDNTPGVPKLLGRNDQCRSLVRVRPEAGALPQNSTQPSFLVRQSSAISWCKSGCSISCSRIVSPAHEIGCFMVPVCPPSAP